MVTKFWLPLSNVLVNTERGGGGKRERQEREGERDKSKERECEGEGERDHVIFTGVSDETRELYWISIAKQLAQGLADNWSQVNQSN